MASRYGHLPVVQWLVQSGADIEAKDNVSIFDVRTVHHSVCYPSFVFTLSIEGMDSSDTCQL